MNTNTAKKKLVLNWSSGKDATLALHHLQQSEQYRVGRLITTINTHHNRVTMHGLRRSLLQEQIEALGLPHRSIELPAQPDMAEYEQLIAEAFKDLKSQGYEHTAFGDIFLEDLKRYREKEMEALGFETVFPLWKRNTREVLQEFLDLGYKAIVVCVKTSLLDASFAGRMIDHNFLKDLPKNVDPCGENGEFHTFCFDGPLFAHPVSFTLGERSYQEYPNPDASENAAEPVRFCFQELLPIKNPE